MKIFECKCGSKDIFIKDSGNNKGLYCADCGKWMQWLGKDDLRLAERQIEQSIVNPIPRNIDELKEHDAKVRADLINELVALVNSDEFKMRCIMTQLPFFEFVANEFEQVIKEQNNED